MRNGHGSTWRRALGSLAIAGTLLATAPAFAGEGPNSGRINFSFANDFTTAYFFRGIVQNREGFITQPYGEVNVKLWEKEESSSMPFNHLTLVGGIWLSIHGDTIGASATGPSHVYETDYYAGLKTTLWDNLNLGAIWYAYSFPSGAYNTAQEIDITASYNDADLLGAFALNPSVVLGFETDNTAFGENEGQYMGIGIAPAHTIFSESDYPVTISAPITLGLGLSDYYEIDDNNNDIFGYLQGGLKATVPLSFIPSDYGSWYAAAGAQVYTFGHNVQRYNEDFAQHTEDPWVVGTWTIGFTY